MSDTDPRLRIIDLRARVLAGETLSKEELSDALRALAASRKQSTQAKEKKESKSAIPLDLNSLFS